MSKFNTITIHQSLAAMTGSTLANHIPNIGDIVKHGKKAMKQKTFKTYIQIQDHENTQPVFTHTKLAQELINLDTGLNSSPFFNGQLLGCKLHPFVECLLATMSPLKNVSHQHFIDEKLVKECHLKFQLLTQTREFNEASTAWEASSASSEKQFDSLIKNTWKHVNGIEMLELTLSYPLQDVSPALRFSLQENFVDLDQIKFIVSEIRKAESDRILAICSKLEMTIDQQLKLRLIILLEREFIDDPEGFGDPEFYPHLKHQFELNSVNKMNLETIPLNGFLLTNKFYKQLPLFKDQIQLMKAYLVGTETLLRVGGTEPTFKILYTKYKG